jgi:hypothetical protein
LVYLIIISLVYLVCGHLVYYSHSGLFGPRKIWQPPRRAEHSENTRFKPNSNASAMIDHVRCISKKKHIAKPNSFIFKSIISKLSTYICRPSILMDACIFLKYTKRQSILSFDKGLQCIFGPSDPLNLSSMTGISLHMQWPLTTSQSNGSFLKENNWYFCYISNSTPKAMQCMYIKT